MPRPIHVPSDQPGITTYKLSAADEFAVLAVTFSLVPQVGAGGDNFGWLDYRDPAGGIIYMQPLATDDGGNMFYSLAVEAEPFSTTAATAPFWPQSNTDSAYSYVSQRLSPQTLYTNCTINVYKTTGAIAPPTDPITQLSSDYTIPDLHLWVEDVAAAPLEPIASGPYMLVGGPNA